MVKITNADGWAIQEKKMYIDGRWVDGEGSEQVEGINPATEETISRTPVASPKDMSLAIEAARRAFDEGPWPRMTTQERSAVMFRFADAVRERQDELHNLMVTESGFPKGPFSGALGAASFIEESAHRVLTYRTRESVLSVDSPVAQRNLPFAGGAVVKEPVGVVGVITPYNAPVVIIPWNLGPALALGNTVVLKPSPYTPLQAIFYAEAAEEAGFPAGVLNIVTDGPGVGEELTTHPGVDKISFTGSTEVARKLVIQAAGTLKRLHLELGGKSACIIFADADLERAISGSLFWLMNVGQQCAALSRILVEESLYDECVRAIEAACKALKIGNPAESVTNMGPLIRESARHRVEEYVAAGQREGGDVVCGGQRPPGLQKGFFYEPTLFTNLSNQSRTAQEEIFGPVAVAIPFRDEDEAIRLANESVYGLIGSVHSGDVHRAWRVANQVRSGQMWINGGGAVSLPYGGFKQSGWGRGHGQWGFDEFVELKGISWPAGYPGGAIGGH